MSCIIRNCKSRMGKKENLGQNISFHRFPKNADICKQWLTATDRSENQHKHHWRVCSRHFNPEYFVGANFSRACLKENAVPTLNLSSKTEVASEGLAILDKSSEQSGTSSVLTTNDTVLTETTTVTQTTEKAIYEGRIHKLENEIQKLKRIAKNRLLKINAMRQQTRRLKKSNSSIKQVLIELLERENKR